MDNFRFGIISSCRLLANIETVSLPSKSGFLFCFWATITNKSSPRAIGPLSVLHVLSVCNVGVLWPNGLMDQDATWYGGRPRPRPHCVRRRPSSPLHGKGHSSLPTFAVYGWPMSTVAKWLDGSGYHLIRRWASAHVTLW